jgi:Caspase domain
MPAAEGDGAVREALIVAADAYEDPKLRSLRAPARDAEALARVLGQPEVGDFRVGVSLNEPDHVVRRKISEFFRDRSREDLLLLHVSCHGLKDEDGTLYFASANTTVEHLEATAIPSEFVNRQMTKSRSRRIVLLLDCCFGGAFARGMVHRAGESVALKEEFEGQGRVVLTASRAMEYAFEGDNREGDAQPSIFTSAIVHGLESGEADRDRDSRVSVDELYDYVYDRVREATPNQTPSKWTFDVQGDLYVARSPFREPEPVELPAELQAAMASPFANVRAGAVEELAHLHAGADAGLAAVARDALEALVDDDSKRVSETAARALRREPEVVALPPAAPPEPPAQAPTVPQAQQARRRSSTTASRVAVALARAAQWQDGLALLGAALFVLAYFRRASWDSGWYFATSFSEWFWALWSPLEAFGAALLVVAAVLAKRRGWVTRVAADGLLVGVGAVACAAMLALVASWYELAGLVQATGFGALAIVAAGALGILTRRAPEIGLPRLAVAAGGAGAVLGFSPLVVDMAVWEDSALLQDWDGAFAVEVALAGGAAIVVLAVLLGAPRLRIPAGGALIGIGAMLALHVGGIAVQLVKEDGAKGPAPGCALGVAGGLLMVLAGAGVLRAGRREAATTAPGLPAT